MCHQLTPQARNARRDQINCRAELSQTTPEEDLLCSGHRMASLLQGLTQKYELNKKWFFFYAGALGAAYLYLQPLIRRKLGSAERSASQPMK